MSALGLIASIISLGNGRFVWHEYNASLQNFPNFVVDGVLVRAIVARHYPHRVVTRHHRGRVLLS